MASLWDIGANIWDSITGGRASSEDYENALRKNAADYDAAMSTANKQYEQDVANALAKQKSAKELYAEGKETASAAASNKAGLAKRNAKAASMQTNGSKLMAAIQGAQAATDAATEGFDENASNAAAMGHAQNVALVNSLQSAAENKRKNAQDIAAAKMDAGNAAAKGAYDTAAARRQNTNALLQTGMGIGAKWLMGK